MLRSRLRACARVMFNRNVLPAAEEPSDGFAGPYSLLEGRPDDARVTLQARGVNMGRVVQAVIVLPNRAPGSRTS